MMCVMSSEISVAASEQSHETLAPKARFSTEGVVIEMIFSAIYWT